MIELDVIDPQKAEEEARSARFWRSPADLKQRDAFQQKARQEFGDGTSEPPSGASRRQFLQLMAASMAMAGLTACRRPAAKILPYARKPEEVIPGIAQRYATAMPFRGIVRPLLVESHEGRPTKAEGNPEHPASNGGTSAFEQASILNLYDPDRSRTVLRNGSTASWTDFVDFARDLADGGTTRQMAVLHPSTSSPTILALRERLGQRFPNMRWVTYDAGGESSERLGMQEAFGRPLRPQYNFDEAEIILSLDADFLSGLDRNFEHHARTFAQSRRLDEEKTDMSRLYVIESAFTTTGGTADHRMRMAPSRIPAFAAAVGAELGVGRPPSSVSFSAKEQRFIREIARDLKLAGGRAVVLAGETQPPAVQALAMDINERLGALGRTVTLLDTGEGATPPQSEELQQLVADMKRGQIEAAFLMGVNPVYDAPAELDLATALRRVNEVVHTGLHVDETARAASWHLPATHYLEAWGDGRSYDGTLSVVQPLIAPLYDDAHSHLEILNVLATGVDAAGYDLVREQWRTAISGNFEQAWRRVLHDGFLPDTAYPSVSASTVNTPQVEAPSTRGYDLVFRLDPALMDGSYANNAWMQELPDPTTKIVWDNVALVSPKTARDLGMDPEAQYDAGNYYTDRLEITAGGQTITLPAWIQPGFPDGTIGLNYGYGRALSTTRANRRAPFWDTDEYTDIYGQGPLAGGVADDPESEEAVGAVGVNVAPLAPLAGRIATGAQVERVADDYKIVTTQEHGAMEGRPIIRWATLDEFKEDPTFASKMDPPVPGAGHGGDGHGGGGGHGAGGDAAHGSEGAAQTEGGVYTDGDDHGEGSHAGGDEHHAEEDEVLSGVHGPEAPHTDAIGHGAGGDGHGDETFASYPTLWESRHPKDSKEYVDNAYYDNQWGMVIDLNTCTGCNACVVACTSENNVQVVGKEEVSRGRHMYWLRMDRYYVSPPRDLEADEVEVDEAGSWREMEDPQMMMQPVMCQHCENAPCESVCPVAATVHSPDGTNQMIYNRCIGTRYCSNNCPYKVRRFNFYNWTKTLPLEVQMAQNPNVSVRFRGVMEKCSFCIHRVRHGQRRANNEGRTLRDGEVQTACQQACPADAITFGDLNDPNSQVVAEKQNARRYELLAYLNVKPRLSYLGRVRNANPRLEPKGPAMAGRDAAGGDGAPTS